MKLRNFELLDRDSGARSIIWPAFVVLFVFGLMLTIHYSLDKPVEDNALVLKAAATHDLMFRVDARRSSQPAVSTCVENKNDENQ